MNFYISTVSVRYVKRSWFRKKNVEELVSVGISTEHGPKLIISLKGVDYWGMPIGVLEDVLWSLRMDHELPNWMFRDFDSYLCVDSDKAAALIEAYVDRFSDGSDLVYSLRPQDDWHLVRDIMPKKRGVRFNLCMCLDQMLLDALYNERLENLDRDEHTNLIRHEDFPKGSTTCCSNTLSYSIDLHKFLKKHA